MTAAQIIEHLLIDFETDQTGLADLLGVHKSTISNIQNGHTQNISSNLAQKILQQRPEISYDFLMGKSNTLRRRKGSRINPEQGVVLPCAGKKELSIPEIMQFIIQNIPAFEQDEQYIILKTSIQNETKIQMLEEHIGLRKKNNTTN